MREFIQSLEARRLMSAADGLGLPAGVSVSSVAIGDVRVYIQADDNGKELRRSDLNGENTQLLKRWEGADTAGPSGLIVYHGTVFFVANSPTLSYSGTEPWKSDGTPEGTVMVRDIYGGAQGSSPHDFVILNDHLLFQAKTVSLHQGLFVTDGTWDGTIQLNPTVPSGYYNGLSGTPRVEGDRLYFETNYRTNGYTELWRTDGTLAGTESATGKAWVTVNQIHVYGTEEDDIISIETNLGQTTILINGVGQGLFSPMKQLVVYALGGNDKVFLGAGVTVSTTLYGNNGNDTLRGGSGDDRIIDSWGADSLSGGGGNDFLEDDGPLSAMQSNTLFGDDGNDTIIGSANDEIIDGGAGSDFIDARGGNDTITDPDGYTTPTGANIPVHASLSGGVFTIVGTDSHDTLIIRRRASNTKMLEAIVNGVPRSFRLTEIKTIDVSGLDGNDTITFEATVGTPTFAVRIRGGEGNDAITGSAGPDHISGGAGNDWISGGNGNDTLYGDAGNDRLFGGNGSDYINAGAGIDAIRGGDGRDRLYVTSKIDDYKGNYGDILSLLNM